MLANFLAAPTIKGKTTPVRKSCHRNPLPTVIPVFGTYRAGLTACPRAILSNVLPYARNTLSKIIIDRGRPQTDEQIEAGFHSAFLATDQRLGDDNQSDYVGTTAICVFITKTNIFFINCGV